MTKTSSHRIPHQDPLVSVVIPTHNRRDLVLKTVNSLLRQNFPAEDYEVIVIDNASSDDTRPAVEAAIASTHISMRYHYEEKVGLSHARNAGLELALGKYIAFIDDDEEAAPLWIQGLVDAFHDVSPQPGIVCGPVYPAWERQPYPWLIEEFWAYFSVFVLDSKPMHLQIAGWGFPEGNSAFRTDVLKSIGGFATNVGRQGRLLLAGEGKRVEDRIRSRGLSVFYQPSMAVDHFIPAERVSLRWLVERAYYQGITDAKLFIPQKEYSFWRKVRYLFASGVHTTPYLLSTLYRWTLAYLPSAASSRKSTYVARRLRLSRRLGWLHGIFLYTGHYVEVLAN